MKEKINFPVLIFMDGHIVSYRKNWIEMTKCGVNDLDKNFKNALVIDNEGRSFTVKKAKILDSESKVSFLSKLRNKTVNVDLSFKKKSKIIGFDELKLSLVERLDNDDLMIDEDFWENEVIEKVKKANSFKKLFKAFRKKVNS